MRLGISSAAAPDASFDELLSACVQRGLDALELRAGHGHGLSVVTGEVLAADARERAADAHIVIAGFRTDDATDAPALAALSRALAAPVIVAGSVPVEQRIAGVRAIVAAGGDAVVAARGAARDARRSRRGCAHGTPGARRLSRTAHPGAELDALPGRLGNLARPPGRLGLRKQRRTEPDRVAAGGTELNGMDAMKGESAMRATSVPELVALDVRPVEPKDRFERIMGTYDALGVGSVMELTVDHDPQCMYYTLRATRGDDTFSFDYLEKGPETWRVLVGKRAPSAGAG